jgi:hypothetical protein
MDSKKKPPQTIKHEDRKTTFRCQATTPSANPTKKVDDYVTRAIIFDNKEDIVRVATAMLSLVDDDKIHDSKARLHITVNTKKQNDNGFYTTVVLTGVDEEDEK